MIYDTLENLKRYVSALPGLETVCEVVESGVLDHAKDGSYATKDPKVRYNVMMVTSGNDVHSKKEVHKNHADVQICLEGGEEPEASLHEYSAQSIVWNADGDAGFLPLEPECRFDLVPGRFLLFFPGEPHMGNYPYRGKAGRVRKVVFKVESGC